MTVFIILYEYDKNKQSLNEFYRQNMKFYKKNKENINAEMKILLPHSKVAVSSNSSNTAPTFFENADKQDLQPVLDLLNSAEISVQKNT